jgi:hypothetical protein
VGADRRASRRAIRWAALASALCAAGCCENPRPVADAAPPRLAALRVTAESSRALPRGPSDASSSPVTALLVRAFQLAGAPGARAALETLVAESNTRLGAALGGHTIGAVVPLSSRDLVIYSGTLAESLRARPTAAPGGGARDGFEAFAGLLEAEMQKARSAGQPPPRVEPYFLWEGRDLRGGMPGADSASRRQLALDAWDWALRQIRLDPANRTLAADGKDVTVVQTDTGYTRNCQFADEAGASPLSPGLGYDFFTPKADPSDPNETSDWTLGGVLTQPGHGTRTGTVLGSPHAVRGCTPPQERDKVFGIAPAVTLVPVRYTNGIILGLPSYLKPVVSGVTGGHLNLDVRVLNLATSLTHAAVEGDEWIKQRADVVSISQGGVCSEGLDSTEQLQCALRNAERQGIIVVAAAGQYPYHSSVLLFGKKPVTFPGRFSTTIAVAGSTILAEPWDESARGPEVDITAPAEWVWRGHTVARGEDPAENGADPGQETASVGDGTSFATAITAGVAALWIQSHGGHDALFRQYGPAVASAFRLTLKKTAQGPADVCRHLQGSADGYVEPLCRGVKAWDTARWGPGLLDAAAVVAAPLPSLDEVCAQEKKRRDAKEYALVCPGWTHASAAAPPLDCAIPAVDVANR